MTLILVSFIILGVVASYIPLVHAEEDNSSSENESDSVDAARTEDTANSDEIEKQRLESIREAEKQKLEREKLAREIREQRADKRNEVEIEVERNGQKIKIHARGLNETQIRAILAEKNRLRLQNDSELPENCRRDGATLKCEINGTRTMTIRAGESGNTILQVRETNATTSVELYRKDGELYTR